MLDVISLVNVNCCFQHLSLQMDQEGLLDLWQKDWDQRVVLKYQLSSLLSDGFANELLSIVLWHFKQVYSLTVFKSKSPGWHVSYLV